MAATRRKNIRAFTLVELLVVIGIISVLIAVLLPALGKARESARQVQCLSNMRQISVAIISFATDHNGVMPGSGGSQIQYYDPSNRSIRAAANDDEKKESADWLAWQRKVDFVGTSNPNAADQNITFSGTTKYLGAKWVDHNPTNSASPAAYADANKINTTLDSLFRCPSDNLNSRSKGTFADDNGGRGYSRYSYAMNMLVGNPIKGVTNPSWDGNSYAPGDRRGFTFTGKIASIKRPSEVILLICEDEQTIEDAFFNVQPDKWDGGQCEMLASRHSTSKRVGARNGVFTTQKNLDARGNVCFCDGHGELLSRRDALRGKYTGRPDQYDYPNLDK
jgi:prepilin-type N-terminal cleavage/methylation domain-containing protein/prepilin-type processing-associated H-X9-DG protein